jgi:TonB family protein
MNRHTPSSIILAAALCATCAGAGLPAAGQTQTAARSQTDEGIELYRRGDRDAEAVESLSRAVKERKDDLRAWHYLGLALARQGQKDQARKAHEKAAKLGEELLESLFDSVPYESVAGSAPRYRLLFEEAAASAEKYLELTPKPSKSKVEEWAMRADALRDYVELSEADGDANQPHKIYQPREVTTKARILTRSEPQLTAAALENHVSGTIVLRGVLAFDGKVRGIRVIKGLDYGLTEEAVRAARQIKFMPAMIDGKPVSQYFQVEYNFSTF